MKPGLVGVKDNISVDFSEAKIFSPVGKNSMKLYKIWAPLRYMTIYGTGG